MSNIRSFGRHTVVYSAGNFIYRAASFLLIPLYVRTLPAASYGTLELIGATVLILQSVLASGVAHSAMRFYCEYQDASTKNSVISSALIGSFLFTACGALAGVASAPWLSRLVFGNELYTVAFRIACISVVFEISREIMLSYVRAIGQSKLFIVMSVVQLVTQIAASIFAVVHLRLGVAGILGANLVATFCVWLVLVTFTIRRCGLGFRPSLFPPLLRYGFPLMLSALSVSMFQSADRYFLNGLVSLQALGVYALAMKIANIIPGLLVTPFTNSYGPYRFAIMREEYAKDTYARVARYFLIVASGAMLVVAAFSREALHLITAPDYWSAAGPLPLLLIPGTLGGLNYCFQTGIYVQKSTQQLLYIALISGAINVAGLIVLVPRFGVMGAAASAVIAYGYTLTHTLFIAQRLMPIPYETGRLARIFGAAAVPAAAAMQIHLDNLWQALAVKTAIVACYPVLLLIIGGFEGEELSLIRKLGSYAPWRMRLSRTAL